MDSTATTDLLSPEHDGDGRPFTVLRRAASVSDLAGRGRLVVRIEGHQIVLFETKDGIRATNNRCPHEGYPLAAGSLTDDCVLTCNWHNWKFDLNSGETLVGGDRLRSYPVEIREGEIFVDCTEPPVEQRRSLAWSALEESFAEHDYARLAREIGRLRRADVTTDEIVARSFEWAHDRLEFGMTHAQAVAADWLALHDRQLSDGAPAEEALVPVLELVGHLSWDTLRQPRHPYPEGSKGWTAGALVSAIEEEDEPTAVALVRGFLGEERPYAELEHALARAAFAHYQDYGHSVIYVYKTGQLVERLGAQPWLLFPLVRSLIYATREDQIPEFRAYTPTLRAWTQVPAEGAPVDSSAGPGAGDGSALRGLGLSKVFAHCLERDFREPAARQALFDELFEASAWAMLHFDESWMHRTDQPISKNAGWLDLTHALTFANAVHRLARRYPDLWPPGLLQMGCFVGRLRGLIDPSLRTDAWRVDDAGAFFGETRSLLLDHGQPEYIISAHLVKVWTAVEEEVREREDAPWVPNLLSATRRFFQASHKRKHTLRTMRQALSFVQSE